MTKRKLIWHIFPSFLLVTLLALAAVGWYAVRSMRDFYNTHLEDDLLDRARLLERSVRPLLASGDYDALDEYVRRMGKTTNMRITVILDRFTTATGEEVRGKVVADSHELPSKMELHADRPEIIAALAKGTGSSIRPSETLSEQGPGKVRMMYVAMATTFDDKRAVIRTSLPLDAIEQTLWRITWHIVAAGAVVAVLAAGASLLIARRIARPLREMREVADDFARDQLHRRLPAQTSEEMEGLAHAMNAMAEQLDERIRAVTLQRNELEALLGSMVEAVIAVDHHERIIRMNPAAGRFFSVDPASSHDRSVQEVIRNSDLQRVVAESLDAETPVEDEIALEGDDEVFLQVHGTALRDEGGKSTGAVIVLNDVTRLKKLENIRREFVANVSHELRTPITSIKGFLETVREGKDLSTEDTKRFLGIAARQVDRLNSIIEDLLGLSRIEQFEREGLGVERCRLKNALTGALAVCQAKADARNVPLRLECDEDLFAVVNAPLLEQAVVNLVDNAVKYSEPGHPVHVSARDADADVVISVADSGCGIAPEHLPRLFERFYRVDRARSRKLGGTGLGLAIVKHIAQAHGGRVSVTSIPGKGSTFTIRIPFRPAEDHV